MRKITPFLVVLLSLVISCSNEPYNENSDNGIANPSNYQFERDGSSTVNFDNQKNKILMASELIEAMKDNSKTIDELNGMFNNYGEYFFDNILNGLDLNLRQNTASSDNYFFSDPSTSNAIKSEFDSWINNQVNDVFTNWNDEASPGVAGRLEQLDNFPRRINEKGLQYNQAIAKALVGGVLVDKMLNECLSSNILDGNNSRNDNDNSVMVPGQNFTNMEHVWDSAFGYLYGLDDAQSPELNRDQFLNKYLYKVDRDSDFEGIADDVYEAFKDGRTAILAKDYDTRDEQANIIRALISEVVAIRAVFYLQQGKIRLDTDKARAFHDLSEGYGFIYSLQFTRQPGSPNPYFTKSEVDTMLNDLMLGNGFWDVSTQKIDEISSEIASRFSFTVEEAAD